MAAPPTPALCFGVEDAPTVGKIRDHFIQTTGYAYAGDTTTVTDPNENIRTQVHDVNGWLRQTEDAGGYAVGISYDAAGSKVSVSDNQANGPTKPLWTGSYEYGIAPFLVGETDVDRGDWGYTVDALGERTAWTDAKGQHFSESYDALSRPQTRTEPDLFTQWTWGSSAASHNIGKLASVCTGTGTTCSSSYYSESEAYDSLGRSYQRSIAIPSMGTYTYTRQYNPTTGLLSTLTYPTGSSGKALALQYAYQNGILQSITDDVDSPNVTVWQANAQDPDGQITQETLGNGLVTTHAYDAVTHWLSSMQAGPGGGASIGNLSYLYDEMGNVTQRQDGVHNLTENFYYDNDYRLSYSTLNGKQNLSLAYDQKGNITSRSDLGGGATWTYDPTHVHQLTKVGTETWGYTYDNNGNMLSRAGHNETWTSYNYPSSINDGGVGEIVSFKYDQDRNHWLETMQLPSGTMQTYRVGTAMELVVSGSADTDRDYIYAGGEPVAINERTSTSNTFYYLLTDHQGSISGITNSSGQVVVDESFTAYGVRRSPTTWSGWPTSSDFTTMAGISQYGYTFHRALGEKMDLVDMVGRVEDGDSGRFMSADPTIPDASDPQSYNRYSYARNNPLTHTDPTGFCDENTQCPQEQSLDNQNPGGWSDGGLGASFDGISCAGNCFTTVYTGEQITVGSHQGPIIYTPELVPTPSTGGEGSPAGTFSSGAGGAFGSGTPSFGVSGSVGSLAPPTPPAKGTSPQQGDPTITLPTVVVTQTWLPPPPQQPFLIPPAITPGLLVFDADQNFLNQTLAALSLLARSSIVWLQLHNATGEPQEGPAAPEEGTPEPQTTEMPYNPGPTVRYNGEGELEFSGRVGELPPEFFEIF